MRSCLILFVLMTFFAVCAGAVETTVTSGDRTTELWQGKALTAIFRVGICYGKKGQAQGVLLLRHRNGKEDVYHLYGTLKNNEFYLTHSSGHKFEGRLTGPDRMEGKARLSSGMRLSLNGKRQRNVPLVASDCAPLPEGESR